MYQCNVVNMQLQLQVVDLNTNEELPYWVEYLKPPILWTKVTVDARDYTTIQIKVQEQIQTPNPYEVFEVFITPKDDNDNTNANTITYETNYEVRGFDVVLRTPNSIPNTRLLSISKTYEPTNHLDIMIDNTRCLVFSFCKHIINTNVYPPNNGLYTISIDGHKSKSTEYIVDVRDANNNIVLAKYYYEDIGSELGCESWSIRTTPIATYMYIAKHSPLYVKELKRSNNNTILAKISTVCIDNVECNAQIQIPLPWCLL